MLRAWSDHHLCAFRLCPETREDARAAGAVPAPTPRGEAGREEPVIHMVTPSLQDLIPLMGDKESPRITHSVALYELVYGRHEGTFCHLR